MQDIQYVGIELLENYPSISIIMMNEKTSLYRNILVD